MFHELVGFTGEIVDEEGNGQQFNGYYDVDLHLRSDSIYQINDMWFLNI